MKGLKILILAVWIVTLFACMPSHSKRYYQFYMQPKDAPIRQDKILLVEPVDVAPIYDDYRLVYRLSPHELNYYSYEFWIRMPGLMLREAICDYLRRGDGFEKVIVNYSEADPHWLLKAQVHAVEEIDARDAWQAHLKMTLTVKDFKNDRLLAQHAFDRLETLPEKQVGKLPVVLSQILEQELALLFRKLAPLEKKVNDSEDSEPIEKINEKK